MTKKKQTKPPKVYTDSVPWRTAMKRVRNDQCPFCGCPETERDDSGTESCGTFSQESSCTNDACGRTWGAVYTLTDVQ